jgi:hypothetical protein
LMAARQTGRRPGIRAVTAQEPPDFTPDSVEFDESRIPPHDLDAEAAVLSAIMLEPAAFDKAAAVLRAEHFYSEANRRIYEVIVDLSAQEKPIDIVSVAGMLRDRDRFAQIGGSAYLAQLVDAVPSVAHIETYAARVHEKWRARQLIATCQRIAAEGYDPHDGAELLARARASLEELSGVSSDCAGFRTLTLDELIAPIPPVNYVIEKLDICPGRPTQVAGTSFGGKTIALASATTSIIVGRRVWGEFWCRQGPCAYVDYEMGRGPSLRRFRRIAVGMGVSWERDVAPHLRLATLPAIYLNTAGVADHLKRIADGMVLVGMDSLRRALPGVDENDSAITEYVDLLTRVSEETGAAFVFAHHSTTKLRKGDEVDPRGAGRGSSAIFDASGAVLSFTGAKGEPVRVTQTKAPERGTTAEDFYLVIEDVDIDSSPRAGVRVVYRTIEQVEGVESADDGVSRDVDRIVTAIRREEPAGVRGADAAAKLAGMKAQAGRAALRIAISRNLVVNVATLRDGTRDERHPLYVTAECASTRPPIRAGRGTSDTESSGTSRDERGTRDDQASGEDGQHG